MPVLPLSQGMLVVTGASMTTWLAGKDDDRADVDERDNIVVFAGQYRLSQRSLTVYGMRTGA